MPWCPDCDRWLAPPSVRADGGCPRCGTPVDAGRAHAAGVGVGGAAGGSEQALPPIPVSLKLLAGAAVVYLGFRALQGVAWVVDRL